MPTHEHGVRSVQSGAADAPGSGAQVPLSVGQMMRRGKLQGDKITDWNPVYSNVGKQPSREVKAPGCTAMGCGGSRTDALEPRYLESWTKETESTWLTSTDTDLPLSSIQSIPSEHSEAGFTSEKSASPVSDLFEDSLPLPAQAYLKVCSALSEVSLNDAKSRDPPPKTDSPAKEDVLPTPGTKVKRTSVLHTQEITKWQDNRMSTKQVTITVTQSIHQVDKNKKVKKSLTTYEVMKPMETRKQVATQKHLSAGDSG